MPKFTVFVSRMVPETATIEIEAESLEQACELAYDQRNSLEYQADDICVPLDYDINAELV